MTNAIADKTIEERGVEAAVKFLERKGYEILESPYTCKAGTADIVAVEDNALVFTEVKTRSNTDTGLPEEAIEQSKRKAAENIAISYLSDHEVADTLVRFDIISILVVGPDRAFLRHHRNAFSLG